MAVLEKLRGWGIVLSILVALPLLLFILDPSQIAQTVQSVSSKYDVGKINGKSVSYTDFHENVEKYNRLAEIMYGTSSSEEIQRQMRDAAWQELIDKYLFIENAQAAGIRVGKEEMRDLTIGENPSYILASNPMFAGENGAFSSDRVVEFVQAVDEDETGRLALVWDNMKQSVNTVRYYEKYNALFTASAFANSLMTQRNIEENNTTANVEFVMAPLSYANDSTIVVSPAEIKSYYKNHQKTFRQKASREIEYAVFQVVPSRKDVEEASDEFTRLYDEFAAAENLRAFLQRNSDRQWQEEFYHKGDLKVINPDIEDFVFNGGKGTSPIYHSGNVLYAARVIKSNADSAQVAIFEKEILASKETFNDYYNQANRLATLAAGKLSGYEAAVDSIGIYSRNLTINEGTDTYGSISRAKEVTRWAFDNKPGTASGIITVENTYFFVAAVKEAHKEGVAPLSEVSERIKNILYAEKAAEKKAAEVKAEIEGLETLEAIAEKLGTSVSTQDGVAFGSMSSRNLDPKLIGAVSAAQEGVITGPVAGSYGVYVFKVTGRETGSYYTEDDAKNSLKQAVAYGSRMILPVMMDDTDVKDNRERFF